MNTKLTVGVMIAIAIGVVAALGVLRHESEIVAVDPKNGTYRIEDHSVTLVNGFATEESITSYFGNAATGDLDADGDIDTAFLLTQSGSGTGAFYYVVVALRTDTGWVGTNAVLLGDRIAPKNTEIRDGIITVNYAERKPGDSFDVRPSVGVSKRFHIKRGKLVEILN